MASFPAVTMTTEGLNMIAKASSGNSEDRLIVTKVKFGDGVSEGNIREYTDVISPKMEVTLAEWEDRGDGRFRYTFIYNNSGVKTGFYHREIGLFAKSGNDGGEKLIAYSNAGSYPGYIDDETKEIPYQRLMINIGVGDTDNVAGKVDVSNAVTIEILNEHNNDENAHAKLIKKLFGSSEATLESVKEKVNDWAKEVCLPLSGGEMTGDITANNVYANNNVLVFNNVKEMKSSNKVKAGYTIKTLGFYEANDGGEADYVITNDIGEDETDETSIITLQKGLYAKKIAYLNKILPSLEIGITIKNYAIIEGENFDLELNAIKEIGIKYVRTSAPVNEDTFTLELVKKIKNNNLIPLLVLYSPATALGNVELNEGNVETYIGKIKNTITYFKNNGVVGLEWEVMNEPDRVEWQYNMNSAQYSELCKQIYSAVKEIDNTATIIAPALSSNVQYDWFLDVANNIGDCTDSISIHTYPISNTTPNIDYISGAKNLINLLFKNKKIVSTEAGYSTKGADAITETERAEYLPKLLLYNLAYGINRTFVYTAITKENDTENKEEWFGILNHDYSLKETATAIKNLLNITKNLMFIGVYYTDKNALLLTFIDKSKANYKIVGFSNNGERYINVNGTNVPVTNNVSVVATIKCFEFKNSKHGKTDNTFINKTAILNNTGEAIGNNSVVANLNNKSYGANSFACGNENTAGLTSFVTGLRNVAYPSKEVHKVISINTKNRSITLDGIGTLAIGNNVLLAHSNTLSFKAYVKKIEGNTIFVNTDITDNILYVLLGYETISQNGMGAFVAGTNNIVTNYNSVSFGNANTITSYNSASFGEQNNVKHINSMCAGIGLKTTNINSMCIGRFNKEIDGYFIIGNGNDINNLSNAFRVDPSGAVYGTGSFNSTGADYAEFFEWLDGNIKNEDRVGYFVTLEGDKIKKSTSNSEYILGVVSVNPSIIGNSHEDQWKGMYEKDEWGRIIYDNVEGEMIPKISSKYNNDEVYIPRNERKEWSVVGMLGVLLVRDDGSCIVNGYCKPNTNGIATKSNTGYRVIGRITENIIKIIFK